MHMYYITLAPPRPKSVIGKDFTALTQQLHTMGCFKPHYADEALKLAITLLPGVLGFYLLRNGSPVSDSASICGHLACLSFPLIRIPPPAGARQHAGRPYAIFAPPSLCLTHFCVYISRHCRCPAARWSP